MGMFVVAPAASFNHHHGQHDAAALNLAAAAGDPMNSSNATALGVGVGVGVIPLLTAAPCLAAQNMDDQDFLNNGRSKFSGIQFWQNQPAQYNNNTIKKTTASVFDHNHSSANLLPAAATGVTIGGTSNSGSSGTTTCLDCGNQAKKDCSHRRCRTCCKSRGYDCSTHVKSTWVPAARRRERQLMAAGVGGGSGGGAACSTGSSSGTKKPRLTTTQTTASHTSNSNATTPRSFETSSSNQGFDAGFKEGLPRQVRAPAVFKCVKVTAVDDGEDEYAYQAVVKIGGHVFKGFLYDQGQCFPNISELHLGGGEGGRNGASSSAPIMDPDNPADLYGGSGGGGLLGSSTAYGNPMN